MKNPRTVAVNINTNCKDHAITQAKKFADMFYTDSAYSTTVCKKANEDCYVVVMGNDSEQCEKTALQRVADWQADEETNRVSDDTALNIEINIGWFSFLAILLSAICLLGYCSQSTELELAEKELTQCK